MRTFSITDVGMVRQVNQDYVFEGGRPLGILRNLFVVADGMGGHQAGDYASKYTVEVLQRELEKSQGEDIERVLVNAIKTANREIIREASKDEHLKGMGTTVVAATIMNQMMYFANVGDSRLYLINHGIQQLRWYVWAVSNRKKQSITRIRILLPGRSGQKQMSM